MNYLCDHYFKTKDDINNVLLFLDQAKPDKWAKLSAADEKIFELFETELFVLSHLDDKNLNINDVEVLLEFVKPPSFVHDFEQKLNDIAMMFSELDKLLQKKFKPKDAFIIS